MERGEAWRFVGMPDGIRAYDTGSGTIAVLGHHELEEDEGTAQARCTGSCFVGRVADKEMLGVLGDTT